MLFEFQEYLSFENIYLWSNFGLLPFWLMLILIPNSKLTQILINSIILPLIISSTYCYLLYHAFASDEPFLDILKLYLSLDNLYTIFSIETFLLVFWLHFVSINLFLGSWIARDAFKYNISRKLVFLPLVFVYLTGPVGLVLYWMIRIFFAKRLGFHD